MECCPFCQSQELNTLDLSESLTELPIAYISCPACQCLGPSGRNLNDAAAKWNKRHERAATENIVAGALFNCLFCCSKKCRIKAGATGYFVQCGGCKASGPIKPTPVESSKAWNNL